MRIISVSRRTDIPAFYGGWFLQRIKEGFAGYINPFGGQRHKVSLKPADVACLVFWSKNYTPFIKHLDTLAALGYRFYLNFTITGLPSLFEPHVVPVDEAIRVMRLISGKYPPQAVNWRYDPVVLSGCTDSGFHLANFRRLAARLQGYVQRCYFSYVHPYARVQDNFTRLETEQGHNIHITSPGTRARQELALQLADIACAAGMQLYTCCGDYLLGEKIHKAHCVDGALIEKLFYPAGLACKQRPTRKECGCTESTDIGMYDTCVHGCVYCYANTGRDTARARFRSHDPGAAFLGYSKARSDAWLQELQEKAAPAQGGLFT